MGFMGNSIHSERGVKFEPFIFGIIWHKNRASTSFNTWLNKESCLKHIKNRREIFTKDLMLIFEGSSRPLMFHSNPLYGNLEGFESFFAIGRIELLKRF